MVFCILLRKEGVVNDNCDTMRGSETGFFFASQSSQFQQLLFQLRDRDCHPKFWFTFRKLNNSCTFFADKFLSKFPYVPFWNFWTLFQRFPTNKKKLIFMEAVVSKSQLRNLSKKELTTPRECYSQNGFNFVLTLLGLFVRKIVSDYPEEQFAFLISPSPIPKNPLW